MGVTSFQSVMMAENREEQKLVGGLRVLFDLLCGVFNVDAQGIGKGRVSHIIPYYQCVNGYTWTALDGGMAEGEGFEPSIEL